MVYNTVYVYTKEKERESFHSTLGFYIVYFDTFFHTKKNTELSFCCYHFSKNDDTVNQKLSNESRVTLGISNGKISLNIIQKC